MLATWEPFVRASYELVMESESRVNLVLDHTVEAYVVHLVAKNFDGLKLTEQAVAIQMLEGKNYQHVADECLLINSYPIKRRRWPSETYYRDMGTIAYGLANLTHMEQAFDDATIVLKQVFGHFG